MHCYFQVAEAFGWASNDFLVFSSVYIYKLGTETCVTMDPLKVVEVMMWEMNMKFNKTKLLKRSAGWRIVIIPAEQLSTIHF